MIFISGMLLAFFYTATPVGLKYKALGDVTIFLCFGPLLMQCVSILLIGGTDNNLYLYSIPIGLLTEGILHANNARDIKADSEAGAVTFANIIGYDYSYYFYIFLIAGSYISVLLISYYSNYATLLAFVTLPLGLSLIQKFKERKLIELPEDTAKMHLPFGIMMLIGILITDTGLMHHI